MSFTAWAWQTQSWWSLQEIWFFPIRLLMTSPSTFPPSLINRDPTHKARSVLQTFLHPVCTSDHWVIRTEATCPSISNLVYFFFFTFFLWAPFNESSTVCLYPIGKIRIKGGSKRKPESVIKVVKSWKISDIKEAWYKRFVSVFLNTHDWGVNWCLSPFQRRIISFLNHVIHERLK